MVPFFVLGDIMESLNNHKPVGDTMKAQATKQQIWDRFNTYSALAAKANSLGSEKGNRKLILRGNKLRTMALRELNYSLSKVIKGKDRVSYKEKVSRQKKAVIHHQRVNFWTDRINRELAEGK